MKLNLIDLLSSSIESKDWLFLLVFSLIYIVLAIIMLSFVDKDQR